MFTVDVPYVAVQSAQVRLVAQASSAPNPADNATPANRTFKGTRGAKVMAYCQDVDSTFKDSAFNSLPVLQGVFGRLGYRWDNATNDFNAPPKVIADVINSKVTVTEVPQHGTVARLSPSSYFWQYTPKPGYAGKDKVSFVVDMQGRRFTIVANLLVHEVVNENAKPAECEKVFRKGAAIDGMNLDQTMDTSAFSLPQRAL